MKSRREYDSGTQRVVYRMGTAEHAIEADRRRGPGGMGAFGEERTRDARGGGQVG